MANIENTLATVHDALLKDCVSMFCIDLYQRNVCVVVDSANHQSICYIGVPFCAILIERRRNTAMRLKSVICKN
jgi:hypothetical protein